MFCVGPIIWFSKTPKNISVSSTEAEYIAMAETVKGVLFAQQNVNLRASSAIELKTAAVHEDSSGTIHLTDNPMSSTRSTH